MQRQYSPGHILAGLFLSLILVSVCAIWLAARNPWLGLELEVTGDGIKIVDVVDNGPAHKAGIKSGGILKQLSVASGDVITLTSEDIKIEPDDYAFYKNYLIFFERQSSLYRLLLTKKITLTTSGGQFELTPRSSRPISDLSFYFWFQLFCAYSIVVMGVLVWMYSQNETASRLYALAAIGLLIAIVPSAIYTTRELVLEGNLFHWLSRTNQLGVMLFAGPGTALFWFYPKPLHRFPILCVIVFLVCLFLLLNYLQVYESLDNAVRLPVLFWLILDMSLGVAQWVRSEKDPVSRAQLKWFIVAWVSGPIVYVGLNVVPLYFNFEPLITQKTGWFLFVLVYLGMAFGMRRYRLFNLDRWILHAWFWLLCGGVLVIFEALLFAYIGLNHEESIIISLALIGWAYFPVRQYMFDRFARKRMTYNSRQLLPELLMVLLIRSKTERPGTLWPKLLEHMYRPVHYECVDHSDLDNTIIENYGQSILVPRLPGCESIRLYHANKGSRLFSPQDVRMIDAMYLLYKHIIDFQNAHQQGAIKERKRLARDLHDDVSSKVLSLIYRSKSDENADLGREILNELRNVINELEDDEPSLKDNLDEWQYEARQRCEDAGLILKWMQSDISDIVALTNSEKSNLRKVIRESITNIIKHAEATEVNVEIQINQDHLYLKITDNGKGFDVQTVRKGRGLLNMRRRMEEMGACIEMHSGIEKGSEIILALPLFSEATA